MCPRFFSHSSVIDPPQFHGPVNPSGVSGAGHLAVGHALITGGAGFIGSHLCDRFVREGYQVTVLDNLVTGQRENLAHLEGRPGFDFHLHDVSLPLPPELFRLLETKRPLTHVLHFACPASPADFARLPLEILKVDSLGTFHTADLALKSKARYVLASTSEIYGDPLVHPQEESYWGNVNTVGPRSCYDETKRFAEATISTYAKRFGLRGGIARIFNTYGPRMRLDDGRVVPNFCGQALRGEDLTIYGSGSQTRSFCYVDDLVEGLWRLALSECREPVNLGNPVEYRIADFAREVLARVPQTRSQLVFRDLPQDDPRQRRPVIDRARKELGWEPKTTLSDGLDRTLAYFKERC